MPLFKFYARELLQQRRFVMLEPDMFKFLMLLMCHASQDDGYLLFEELLFQFRGLLDETELKNNLIFLEEQRFINQVNHSEFIESRSYGWHRNNPIGSKSDNKSYKNKKRGGYYNIK
jgi:hypothetical protein